MINSIAFTWDDQEDADLNLQSLTLPELTSLEMRGNSWQVLRSWYQWPSWVSSTTAEFLTRSACSITSLSLVWLPITDQQTIDLLELMPTLTSLEIVERETNAPNVIITGKFTRRLVVDSQTSPFLPFLTKIMLAMQTKGLVEQDLLDVISSRWNPDPIQARESGVECLRSVGITVTGKHTGQDSLSSLARFKAEGLQLNVTRETPDFRASGTHLDDTALKKSCSGRHCALTFNVICKKWKERSAMLANPMTLLIDHEVSKEDVGYDSVVSIYQWEWEFDFLDATGGESGGRPQKVDCLLVRDRPRQKV
ncbi:hypothetical protein AAF712_007187 [Marasmius tenuissimus]|uniref:Uncharacterized protein n=1 Tax=Marasmius tenuissimus TaxID=585030 RepID=A0ABR2ZYK9_9AGAR